MRLAMRGLSLQETKAAGQEEGRSALAVEQIAEDVVERSLSVFEFL